MTDKTIETLRQQFEEETNVTWTGRCDDHTYNYLEWLESRFEALETELERYRTALEKIHYDLASTFPTPKHFADKIEDIVETALKIKGMNTREALKGKEKD